MIPQSILNAFNALAIGQYTQALNNRLFDLYGIITASINTTKRWELTKMKSFFLVGYEDFSTISSQLNNRFSVDTNMDTAQSFHLKSPVLMETMETISADVRTKLAPKIDFLMRTSRIFRHIRNVFFESIKKGLIVFRHVRRLFVESAYYLLFRLIFSRQASLTHALKLPLPAAKSICASKSSSKRICFVVLFERSKDFLSFLSCIGSYRYDKLNLKGSYHYIGNCPKKAMPRSAGTLSRHLTQPLTEVMIMANRYDSAHLRAEQSKLFKFYDLSTAQVVQSIALTEPQARKQLGKQSLIFIAQIRLYSLTERFINLGGYSHV